MPEIKKIRTKIKSIQSTCKITKAMEMVAASKMRKVQERMFAGRPYANKVRQIAVHLMHANPEYSHPYLMPREVRSVGIIVIFTDKGLCGPLNTNNARVVLEKLSEFETKGISVKTTAFGDRAVNFLIRIGSNLISQETQIGDNPDFDRFLGAIKVQLDAYLLSEIDALYVVTTRFINTMRQEPLFLQLLPLPSDLNNPYDPHDVSSSNTNQAAHYSTNYIYEPNSRSVIDSLLQRYVESLLYQSLSENIASEQSARMVAMKAATDNAKKAIEDLQIIYNKTRQASITKEISEIVGGASATL